MGHSLLVSPYGGELVNLTVPPDQLEDLRSDASRLPSLQISERSVCDLELLACGAFSPLDRFVGEDDYQRILGEMRLCSGHIFPVPVALPIDVGTKIHLDQNVALRNARNELLAILTVEELYKWDKTDTAERVFGTTDPKHPLVAEMAQWGNLNVSGRLRVLQLPNHYDFRDLRLSPSQVRNRLDELGHGRVVAFQTRNPLHRAHEEMGKQAAARIDGALLLHPVVGMTKPGDIDHYTRVRTYKLLAEKYYDRDRVVLALLPLAMRLAGPREALWHALIRRNYGASHLIVGRDHASPGQDSSGKPFYGAYDAQELVQQFSEELGVGMISFHEMAYFPNEGYREIDEASKAKALTISGTHVREEYLQKGRQLPAWFIRPEIATMLAEAYPPRHQQGFCIWFTGLSGAGKSTTAEILTELLLAYGRRVTVLDGDVVRTHLSRGLGFSKQDRDTNILRIGFVASEIVRHGGVAVCAAVSPYRASRNEVRNIVGADRFIEVFVDTPLAICQHRDPKGIYAQARRGKIKGLTGIDDPYEIPERPEITLNGASRSAETNAEVIIRHLQSQGLIGAQ